MRSNKLILILALLIPSLLYGEENEGQEFSNVEWELLPIEPLFGLKVFIDPKSLHLVRIQKQLLKENSDNYEVRNVVSAIFKRQGSPKDRLLHKMTHSYEERLFDCKASTGRVTVSPHWKKIMLENSVTRESGNKNPRKADDFTDYSDDMEDMELWRNVCERARKMKLITESSANE